MGEFGTRAITAFTEVVRFPKAEGYNIRIGNQWFRTIANDAVQLQVGTKDQLAERQDRAGSVYENVLDIGYAWARTDLSGGEGLDWDPRDLALDQGQAALDQIRYWDSNGLDVRRPDTAGIQYSMKLARSFETWGGGPYTDLKDMTNSKDYIYVADGSTLYRYTSWGDTTPTAPSPWALPAPIRAVEASPNDTVMVTCENGNTYAKGPDDADFTLVYGDLGATKLESQGIWYEHGRFILSTFDESAKNVSELRTIDWIAGAWAASDPIDTANSQFWSVVESGPAVVAACGDGTVRTYTPAGQGDMTLIPRGRTTMPEGEQPLLLGSNAGVLLIMTTEDIAADNQHIRMYQAEILDSRYDFTAGQMQLRREWNAVEHEGLVTRNMTNTRDEIWWFVKEWFDGAYVEALWRFDVVTNGLSRIITVPGVNLNGLISYDNIGAGVDFTSDTLLITDPSVHQTEGWMIFPNITFGVNTEIAWIATILEAQDIIEGGGQVELWRSTNPSAIMDHLDPSWVLVQRISSQGASGVENRLVGLESRTMALQLKVYSTDSRSKSPRITRTAVRGIPSHRDLVLVVPINVSDYVSAPGRKPIHIPGLGNSIHEQVLSLVGSNVEALMLDPPIGFRGIVNNVSEPINFQAPRGSVTRYCLVELRGQHLTATATATGDAGMGLGLLGISTMGLGQTERT